MSQMEVSPWLDKWGKRVCNHTQFWLRLGRLENAMLSDRLAEIPVVAPIFVCGMARSGSTILLEIINEHFDTKSFTYRDFPFVHIPWFWSQVLSFSPIEGVPVERAHKDRIMITPQSPEAMEEMLWMHTIPNLHSEELSHLKDGNFECGAFANHYISTIKKLLLISGKSRYLSKGNYNITRIKYLLKLFPDARFVIPIRHPISHVRSSIKQHQLFLEAEKEDRRVLDHLQRVGHFEFGNSRQAVNSGNPSDSIIINQHFAREENLSGYSKQWSVIYEHIYNLLTDPEVANAITLVKYEELCEYSQDVLINLFSHIGLDNGDDIIDKYIEKLTLPKYYEEGFSGDDVHIIKSITNDTASKFGYSFDQRVQVKPSVR
jgi:Sulfotransferase family